MAKTTNYGFPLPEPRGIQIAETAKIAAAITDIDVKLKEFSTSLANHKHKFSDLTGLPTTLEGYGIQDAMTAEQTANAIKDAVSALLGGAAPEALDTLAELATALGDDPDFAANVSKALGLRVSVDDAQDFTLAQKTRGRANLNALGTSDKGVAGGVASLDTTGKVPPVQLPALTTTATVGAAMAGANGKATPDDGDFFGGVLAGGSAMFKVTWANTKASLKSYFDGIYQAALGFVPVRQGFSGSTVHIGWSAGYIQLHVDNTTFGATWPMNITGNAGWANGATYADRIGSGGWTLADIQGQLNWRVTDTRFAGYEEGDLGIPISGNFVTKVLAPNGYVMTGIWTWSPRKLSASFRQPQIHIPNVGWRALGTW